MSDLGAMYSYFLFALLLALQVSAKDWKVGQAVNTTSGVVTGRSAALAGNSDVSEYLSIPYAAPPVGDLRWRPPQNFTSKGVINASKWVSWKNAQG